MSANDAELDQNLLAGMFEACNARDIDAVTAYFADDAMFDWFNGQRFEGKAAIRDIMATAWGMIWVKI